MSISQVQNAPRRDRLRRESVIGLRICAGLMFALGFAVGLSRLNLNWAVWPIGAVCAVGLVLSFRWFLSLDEVARQAHYVSWFWGGSCGFAVAVALFVGAVLAPAGWLEQVLLPWWGGSPARAGFFTGALVATVLPVLGYVLWWMAFWLRRR